MIIETPIRVKYADVELTIRKESESLWSWRSTCVVTGRSKKGFEPDHDSAMEAAYQHNWTF